MKLLGVDTETTGLDTSQDRIIEMGYAIYDTTDSQIYECHSELIYEENNPESEPEALDVHGLTSNCLKKHGSSELAVMNRFAQLAHDCDFIVAHNGDKLDKPMILGAVTRCDIAFPREKPWIDTMTDIDYPPNITHRRLSHLAVDHGFFNFLPHRALFDVITMFQILQKYDFEAIRKNSLSPTVPIRAVIGYADREKAKARRYRWDGERKIWHKDIKEFRLEEEMKEAPFKVVVLQEAVSG